MLFALFTLLWFADLDVRRLIHPDEGRYAEIAREMVVTGDWVTPRVNGLKYFEKPPLQYWATAAAYTLFGVDEWTARLWPALAGWLAVIAIGYAGYALGGTALGTLAGLALGGMLWHAAIAQIVTLDSGLAFFLTLAFAALVTAQRPETIDARRRGWMWLAWAALAGATLSKGLIGVVIPGGALVVYSALTRDLAIWRRMSLVSGLVLFLALTAPWFVAVSLRNDEFAHFFFIHEHFERYLTTEHMRVEPWYYFIPVALIGSLPWVTVLVCGASRAWRDGPPNALGFSWQRFALLWAAFVLVFFSASGSKLASYILPMFGPLALVVGWLLVRLDARKLFRLTLPIAIAATVAAAGLFLGFDHYATRFGGKTIPPAVLLAFGAWLKPAFAVAAAGGIGALFAFRAADRVPTARFWGVAALSLSTLAMLQLAVAGFDAFSPVRSTSAILRAAQADRPFAHDAPFYQVGMYDQTAPFYLGRTTRLAAFRDELALGIDAEPSKQLPTVDAWVAEWSALSRGYAMMPPELYKVLADRGVPMRELARDTRRVVVSRQ